MKKLFFYAIAAHALLTFKGFGQVKAKTYEIIADKKLTSEIRKEGSYIEIIRVNRPKPNTSAESLARINPNLKILLKDYEKLIATAEVSSRFHELYDRKIALLKSGSYPSEHNFSDCETVLRIKHPTTGRMALWLQSDMDVVTDGSDPVRAPAIGDYNSARGSDWFLPATSYSWARASTDPLNPFLDYYPNVIKELEAVRATVLEKQKTDPGVAWREVLRSLDSQIARMRERGMGSTTRSGLNLRRNLLATKDPFVVLPVPWVNKNVDFGPQIGDYAAVIYKDRIYPAILGDAGPSDKVGEASLRIAHAINPQASGRVRAVSDVTVTYLVFPRTAGPRAAPDHALWREKVSELLGELGGISSPEVLHSWE